MALITNISEMRDYLKIKLGAPVNCVEVADSQLDIIIFDTIQDIQRNLAGEGAMKDYLAFPLSAGVSAYNVMDDLEQVVDMNYINEIGGINDLFTAKHNLLYNDMMNFNSNTGTGAVESTGPGSGAGNSGMLLGNYNTQMMYLKEVQNEFAPMYSCYYDNLNKVLKVTPVPEDNMIVLLSVYKRQTTESLYNHSLFKKLAVARAMIQHGSNISKYSMTLPGGGTLNGEAIKAEGIREEDKVEELIRLQSRPPMFIVG